MFKIPYHYTEECLQGVTPPRGIFVLSEEQWALCSILGTKCVTCSYIDKFPPFHNQMSVIHNIFVKLL